MPMTRPTATAIPFGRPAVASAPTTPASQYCRRSSSRNALSPTSRNNESPYIGPYRKNANGYSISAPIAVRALDFGSRCHTHRVKSTTAATPASTQISCPATW